LALFKYYRSTKKTAAQVTKIFNISVSILLWLLATSTCFGQESKVFGQCVGVVDGDTLRILTAEKQLLRVRVAWIDAPESSQAFGQRAKQAMSSLVFGKDVELRFYTVDRYGRLVCMVFVDGQDAGLELIKEGFAWAYAKYLPEASVAIRQSYAAAEATARARAIGLWADNDEPVPPWEFRKREKEQQALFSHEP
jgi:endonuclease YncB( thermonuclease family)